MDAARARWCSRRCRWIAAPCSTPPRSCDVTRTQGAVVGIQGTVEHCHVHRTKPVQATSGFEHFWTLPICWMLRWLLGWLVGQWSVAGHLALSRCYRAILWASSRGNCSRGGSRNKRFFGGWFGVLKVVRNRSPISKLVSIISIQFPVSWKWIILCLVLKQCLLYLQETDNSAEHFCKAQETSPPSTVYLCWLSVTLAPSCSLVHSATLCLYIHESCTGISLPISLGFVAMTILVCSQSVEPILATRPRDYSFRQVWVIHLLSHVLTSMIG